MEDKVWYILLAAIVAIVIAEFICQWEGDKMDDKGWYIPLILSIAAIIISLVKLFLPK